MQGNASVLAGALARLGKLGEAKIDRLACVCPGASVRWQGEPKGENASR